MSSFEDSMGIVQSFEGTKQSINEDTQDSNDIRYNNGNERTLQEELDELNRIGDISHDDGGGDPIPDPGVSGKGPNVNPDVGGEVSSVDPDVSGEVSNADPGVGVSNVDPGVGGGISNADPNAADPIYADPTVSSGVSNVDPGVGGGVSNVDPTVSGGVSNDNPGVGGGDPNSDPGVSGKGPNVDPDVGGEVSSVDPGASDGVYNDDPDVSGEVFNADPGVGGGVSNVDPGIGYGISNADPSVSSEVSSVDPGVSDGVCNVDPDASGEVSNADPDASGEVYNADPGVSGGVSNVDPGVSGGVSNVDPSVGGGVSNVDPAVSGGVSKDNPGVGGGVSNVDPGVNGGVSNVDPDVSGGVSNVGPGVGGGVSNVDPDVSGGYQKGNAHKKRHYERILMIGDNLDSKKKVGGVFIDLSKAFDRVNIDILVKKLEQYGLSEGALKLMSSYLRGRKQSVVIKEPKKERNMILCNAKPNQTLFIIGANRGNGLAAIQVGKAYGLTVFASVGCPVGVSKAYEFGADYVVDHTDPKFREKAKELNNNENFDIILEDYAIDNLREDHEYCKKWTGHYFKGFEQHEMLYPFMSMELRNNLSNLITTKIRDLVEVYQGNHFGEGATACPDTRSHFLQRNVFHHLYGGTTKVTTGRTEYFDYIWEKYSTNTLNLDLTHDSYFEDYVRDYVWWTMPPNRTKPTYPPTTTTDPNAPTTDKYDKWFDHLM
ncbi:hypothetical protein M8J76_012179 [Diaphorina citri]|nr:hypothetical protein M8J76_012179 [Diaphorina citri]